ncbi:ferroxidase fet3 [Mucor velutinosus]|uniref:chitinase n=1 Tax=Mucor velutinosus TaxID=708070 RepID=A0AAN7HRT2_9FUNG|nr:ferroxidase fet3 [Mucor velutinosus]
MLLRSIGITAAALLSSCGVQAAFSSNSPNVMYYWGQNSAGGSSTQGSLASYCNSGQADAVILSFLNIFNVGSLPGINLSSACETKFPGTDLLTCPAIGNDIKTCQSKGVKVILSLGGAAGSYGFTSDAQGQTFAQTIWYMFGGGSSTYRPFGDSTIDGVDLDIEGGPSTGYIAFVNAIRSKFSSGFLVGAAPQCPFPDAILGSVLDGVGLDFVNVQFYNNYCSAVGNSFNYDTWANWAKTTAPNKNVKIYFTIPGAPTAAGSGYAPISTVQTIVPQLASQYPGIFGGVSVWDASQAWNNAQFASQLYSLVKGSGGGGATTTTTTTTTKTTTTATNSSTSSTSTKTSTSTSSSATATATSTPGTCAAAGQACSTEGKYVCTSGGAYAVCVYGKWSVTSCPSNTQCIPTTDGASIYCGYSSGSTTCSALSARDILHATLNKGGAVPKPYKASQVEAQFVVASASADSFKAVINAHRTNTKPFGQTVTIEFTAPSNVKFSSTDAGSVRQVGNSVRIQAKSDFDKNMAIVVPVQGSVNSGVFVAPNPSSLRIK